MKYRCRFLIFCCRELLDTFDEESNSAEDHWEQYLCTALAQDLDDSEKSFVEGVFYGCVRFKSVLAVVVDGFYNTDGINILTAERSLYMVFTYLTLILLSDLGMPSYEKFVNSQDRLKLLKFLQFFLVEDRIRTWMRDEWTALYETHFVDSNFVEPLQRNLQRLWSLTSNISNQLECDKTSQRINVKPSTVPQPFSMSSRVKKLPAIAPMPEVIQSCSNEDLTKRPACRNWRKTLYEEPKISQQLESCKLDNKVKSLMLLEYMNENPMSVWKTEKSDKTKQKMQEIITEQELQRLPQPTKQSTNWNTALTQKVTIRTNVATILREARLYEKREQEELNKLEELVIGGFDASEYDSWQARMRQIDQQAEAESAAMKRLDGQLSKEEAVLAKLAHQNHNKMRAAMAKEEAERLMKKYMKIKLEEQERMRKLAENVINSQQNAKQIKIELQQFKASIVQQMNCEYKAMMQQALEEAELEMRQKLLVIESIREMEARISAASGQHVKMIDPTETAGYGFLCEMSLAELRERLKLQEAAEQARLEALKQDIQAEKNEKDQLLKEALQKICRHREEISQAAADRSLGRKKASEMKYQRTKVRSGAVMEMEQRLEQRKAERLALEQQSRVTLPAHSTAKHDNKTMIERKGRTYMEESLRQVRNETALMSGQPSMSVTEVENKSKSRVALLAL